MSEAVLCALVIALLMILGPLIWPHGSRRQRGEARTRHPAGRRRGLPVDGEPLSRAERKVIARLEFGAPDDWDVLAAEAESFSADREDRP